MCFSPSRRQSGFTYIELTVSMVVLAILAAAVMPSTRKIVKRQKEVELKRHLLDMREAIDRYKRATEEGLIEAGDVETLGYPEDLETLVQGVPMKKNPDMHMRFLRRIPIDPMTGEAEWGLLSVQDEPDDKSWGGENVFDVYSLADGTAMDGTEYREW